MDACTVSSSARLPDYLNKMDLLGCNLNPVVVLTDFRKSPNQPPIPPATPVPDKTPPLTKIPLSNTEKKYNECNSAAIKRDRHKSSSCKTSKSRKRKGDSWDPVAEYEIEDIVGYHRDKRKKMWYLVKWKNWPSRYNTFEPINHLTKCNYKLMQFFEYQTPSFEDINKMNAEVQAGLEQRKVYQKLLKNQINKNDLIKLCDGVTGMAHIFKMDDLEDLERRLFEEYECVIRALIGMQLHQDPGLLLRGQNYKLCLMFIQLRRAQLDNLEAMENVINAQEKTEITLENRFDLEKFPDITYISSMKPSSVFSKVPLLGCECNDKCSPKSLCCGPMSDSVFAYGNNGKLRTSDRIAIYECNSRCWCSETCQNRVVQKGRQVKLCIFKTQACGWGVKAMEKIPKGSFVCEYVGELIPDTEAVVRDVTYKKEKRSGYLFDLDFFADSQLDMYCIDATREGNVARFINHSCDPNLVVYPVWIENIEPNIHRLAFFAKRNINKNEEIHFDYESLGEEPGDEESETEQQRKGNGLRMMSDIRCQCEAANCRKWVFGNK